MSQIFNDNLRETNLHSWSTLLAGTQFYMNLGTCYRHISYPFVIALLSRMNMGIIMQNEL